MQALEILEEIKRKRELKKINDDLIKKLIEKNENYKKFLKQRKKIFRKKVIKEIRATLRKILTPMPNIFYKKYNYFLENIDTEIERILNMNLSFKERKSYYGWLIEEIKKINPKKIFDIGCGLTLLAFYYFNYKPKEYIGYDIDGYIVDLLNKFIEIKGIKGKVFCDFNFDFFSNKDDLILALKVLDGIEKIEKGKTREIITQKGKKIVSFSLRSWSGKKGIGQRVWFEKMLIRENIKFKKIIKENEVFYFF